MADRSSAVKAMRDMADSSHGCNSCSAIVLRRRKLRASVSSYAAASIIPPQERLLLVGILRFDAQDPGALVVAEDLTPPLTQRPPLGLGLVGGFQEFLHRLRRGGLEWLLFLQVRKSLQRAGLKQPRPHLAEQLAGAVHVGGINLAVDGEGVADHVLLVAGDRLQLL